MQKINNKKNTKVSNIFLNEEIWDIIDTWCKKRMQETGGRFSRSSFVEIATLSKLQELGLLAENQQVSGGNRV